MGSKECGDHDMLIAYPVLTEKPGDIVAQFFCTIAVLPRSTAILCGDLTFDEARFKGDHSIQNEEVKKLVEKELWKKEKVKKEKKWNNLSELRFVEN